MSKTVYNRKANKNIIKTMVRRKKEKQTKHMPIV